MPPQINPRQPFSGMYGKNRYGSNIYGEDIPADPFRQTDAIPGQEFMQDPGSWLQQALPSLPFARLTPSGRHWQTLSRHPALTTRIGDMSLPEILMRYTGGGPVDPTDAVNQMSRFIQGGYGEGEGGAWLGREEGAQALRDLFSDREKFGFLEDLIFQAGATPEDVNNLILGLLSTNVSFGELANLTSGLERKAWDYNMGIGASDNQLDPGYLDYLAGTGVLDIFGHL